MIGIYGLQQPYFCVSYFYYKSVTIWSQTIVIVGS